MMAASKRQAAHHYFSVFINIPGRPELAWFGYSERAASWAFYKAIKAAERKPGAVAVDLRQDGNELASVPINVKTPAIA